MKHTKVLYAALCAAVICAVAVPLGAATVDTRPKGLLVDQVDANGPAAQAGIAVNDILTAADGIALGSPADIITALARHKPGDRLRLTVRKGRTGPAAPVVLILGASPDDATRPWMGLSVLTVYLLVPQEPTQPDAARQGTPTI